MEFLKKLTLLLSFFACTMRCVINSAEFWELHGEKATPSFCSVEKIVLLCDEHEGRDIDFQQFEDLMRYLRVTKKQVSFIVEDPDTFDDKKLSWKQLGQLVKSYRAPLCSSASLAHYCGILATSVEFRPRAAKYSSEVCIQDIIDKTSRQVEQIAEYDDGPVLNEEYQKYIEHYQSIIVPSSRKLFANIAAQGCSLENIDYGKLEYPEESNNILYLYEPFYGLRVKTIKDRVEDVITGYAKGVIDFKILHAFAEHARCGVEQVIIYTGWAHINRIKPVLEKLGYRFYQYGEIEYDDDGYLKPLNVAKSFQKFDSIYDPDQELPREMIDYFFEYKKAEARNPWFGARLRIKLLTALAESSWSEEICTDANLSWLDTILKTGISLGVVSAVLCVLKVCCKSK